MSLEAHALHGTQMQSVPVREITSHVNGWKIKAYTVLNGDG